jgi:heavy metal sensor kinase
MSGLPIRLRLTLAFAVAMAVVLGAVGAFLYLRLGATLDERIDESLATRGEELAAVVSAGGADVRHFVVPGGEDGFAQVLAREGDILAGIGFGGTAALLTEGELRRALSGRIVVERDEARLLATPIAVGDRVVVAVVGESLEDRDDALDGLLAQLLVILPVALLLSSGLGYVVAGAALRPVEDMRRRAAEVSAEAPDRRLPLPRARDEVRRLGETLNEMLTRLEAGLERERRFVADASHELRTPLALLKAELELALRRPREAQELAQALRSASEETDRLVQLAEDLLFVAQADQGRLPLRPRPVRVGELLSGVAARFEGRAAGEGRRVDHSAPEGLEVVADRDRLEQALANLVDNALRHGAGTVRLRAAAVDGRVELHVTDEGTGFPASFLPRAFERFSRDDEARGRGGTGLGLAIVEAIAGAHGGTAQAANGDGRGADVWISLPAG